MNTRIEKLRKKLFDEKPMICHERAKYFTEAMKGTEAEPNALRRARAFCHVMENMTIYVQDGELIVGNTASTPKASPVFPEYSVDWIRKEFNGDPYHFYERPGDRFWYTDEAKEELLKVLDYWEGKSLYETFRKILPKECNDAWDIGAIDDTWVSSGGIGNTVVDFELVLKEGLNGVIAKAKERLSRIDLTQPDTYRKYCYLNAIIQANEGVIAFANRYADRCEELSFKAEGKRQQELLNMARVCRNVPANPAQSFHEAVQAVWFVLMVQHIETNGHSISFGRFDQYIYPYYKKDIESGKMTRDDALELVEAMFIKCNELNKLKSWDDTSFFLGYQMFINLAVGGQTADGRDATNELSYIIVEACADLKLFTPSVSIKWFEGTDDRFLHEALIALQEHKGGQPAFYNDLAFMATLRNMGVAEEDLHNWVPNGCIEASIGGKWDFAAKGPWLNVCKVVELALHNGTDPETGIEILPGAGNMVELGRMEAIWEEFVRQMKNIIRLQVITEHVNDYLHCEMDLNAFRSSLVSDCIERGMDMVEGGSVYAADGGPTAGSITAGDCFAAIEHVCFTEKLLTLEQLYHALKTNFEDESTSPAGPEILAILQNKTPKFGNDDDRADAWCFNVEDLIGRTYRYECKSSKYGKGPIPACFSYSQTPVSGNIAFGSYVGATPNGRKKAEAVNNGISPSNGAEKNGPTAVINSVAKMPTIWVQKGAILNMRLMPNVLTTEQGRQRAIGLMKSLFKQKGEHIQFNVVDNETYIEAQQHPENYQDLMVRVSGYSALFTPLAKAVQDDVIARAQMSL
ncbi:MAG: glycyl radical protein [Christensenellaceae bacterium]|jgi:pyruvate formate-lyase/glycerol dehydratase family glycyl radical enzyme